MACLFQSQLMTENGIGDKGLASLSEALKFNTTLTVLYLGRKDKREDIQNAFIKKTLFFQCHQ